jgi:hypothetical protein
MYLLLAYSLTPAQFDAAALDKHWISKNYWQCYKEALKAQKKYPDQALPLIYEASCLLQLQTHKKIVKRKTFSIVRISEIMLKARNKKNSGEHAALHKHLLSTIQDSLIKNANQRYLAPLAIRSQETSDSKTEKEYQTQLSLALKQKKIAESIFNNFHKTFNRKSETWKSKYDQSLDYTIDGFDFEEYDHPLYRLCNTAKNESYLNDIEIQLFYFTNLARINPALFRNTYLKKYLPETFTSQKSSSEYENSLNEDLLRMTPKPLLFPDKDLWKAALAHAEDLGNSGLTGHNSTDGTYCFDRIKTIAGKDASSENCAYGPNRSFSILMLLLIDEGIPSKGHRYNQLGESKLAGIAHRPHKVYGWNTVFDFQ